MVLSSLVKSCSNPSTNITCMARDPHLKACCFLTILPSAHLCQILVSQGSQCASHTAASYGQANLAASKHVDRKARP